MINHLYNSAETKQIRVYTDDIVLVARPVEPLGEMLKLLITVKDYYWSMYKLRKYYI